MPSFLYIFIQYIWNLCQSQSIDVTCAIYTKQTSLGILHLKEKQRNPSKRELIVYTLLCSLFKEYELKNTPFNIELKQPAHPHLGFKIYMTKHS